MGTVSETPLSPATCVRDAVVRQENVLQSHANSDAANDDVAATDAATADERKKHSSDSRGEPVQSGVDPIAAGGQNAERAAIALQDAEAVARVRRGEVMAYDEIVARHQASLRRVVTAIVADPHGAEDVVQDVFLIGYRRLESFRGDAPFGAWIYRIAVREARRARSKWRKAWRMLAPLELAEEQARRDHMSVAEPPESELGEALELLQRLPQRPRAAFVLHVVEGLSYEEIAEVLDCTSGTVGSLIHRARARLAQISGNRKSMPRDGRIPAL